MADDLSTSLISGAIRFTGLGSGTDFDSLVTQLVEVEKTNTNRLETWRAEWEQKSDAFDALSVAMLNLNTTLSSMNTADEFLIKTVASSNSTAMTASATSEAEQGSHLVTVVSMATTDMHMGAAIFSSPEDVISGGSAGTFSFTYGNRQISVDVTSTTTLSQFAKLINSDPENRNYVRASMINDGSGFRLQIRGMDLGAGNDFIIDESLTSSELLANFGQSQFIETQNSGNAQLVVDGWPHTATPTADTLTAAITGSTPASVVSGAGGAFKFTYAGNIFSVSLSSTTTYAELATAVNIAVLARLPSSAFQASALTNASGDLEFTLTGDPGSANQISIVNMPGTSATTLQSDKFTQILGATDGYIERPTNTVSDVIAGVAMNLAAPGSTTLTTSIDAAAVIQNVQTFVDGINTVLTLIKEQTQVTTEGKEVNSSILTGNYGVQMIQQNLKNILSRKGLGFDFDMDPFVSLGSLGITTDTNEGSATFGLLVFDKGAFSSALASEPDAVGRLFSADMYPSTKETVDGVPTESPNFRYASSIRGVTSAGDFSVSYEVSATGEVISASINGYAARIEGTKITADGDGNPARGLAIEVLNLSEARIFNGQIQIKSGKTEELYQEIKKLTDPLTGTLDILKDNYQDIMDSIDEKIAYEERRLTLLESNLRLKFANLEALLGTYESIQTQLESQIKSLSGSSK
ncbi:MAG: flagellar filament capping protein FliD [Desulfovibrionales bacterium]|nr:flagellar filament capping protein FliD [Desulfovibrionales bacterium]